MLLISSQQNAQRSYAYDKKINRLWNKMSYKCQSEKNEANAKI